MPNIPYGPDGDHSEVFRSSGASLLLELGRLVAALLDAAPTFFLVVDSKRAKDIREQIGPKLEAVKAFFEENPKAGMAKHVLARTGGKTDRRVSLAIAYLAVCMTEYFEDAVPLMRAARAVSLSVRKGSEFHARNFPILDVFGALGDPCASLKLHGPFRGQDRCVSGCGVAARLQEPSGLGFHWLCNMLARSP